MTLFAYDFGGEDPGFSRTRVADGKEFGIAVVKGNLVTKKRPLLSEGISWNLD